MRPDKVILAALEATLRLYRTGEARREIPVWRQIAATEAELEPRARAIVRTVADPRVRAAPSISTVGGGSLPGQTQPSWSVTIASDTPDRLLAALRTGSPAVIGRIVDDAVALDLRGVEPDDDAILPVAIRAAIG
jgi:L-seryl-tRNA(Ser) seleniumtransferase